MRPEPYHQDSPDFRDLGLIMERVMLDVRRHWFGAREVSLGDATAVVEPEGELLMFVDTEAERADDLIAGAATRGAYVTVTSFSRPADLAARLERDGYRPVQRHRVYLYHPDVQRRPFGLDRRGLLSFLKFRDTVAVDVDTIGPEGLPDWSEVCRLAFGSRTTRESSLQEKERAFHSMGVRATWYLARTSGRPVGSACVFQGRHASQVLAVGTHPSLRGRGVATALMQRVIADWQVRRSDLLFLDTSTGSTAEKLYVRLGFRPVYQRELYAPVRKAALTEG